MKVLIAILLVIVIAMLSELRTEVKIARQEIGFVFESVHTPNEPLRAP